MTSYNDKSFSKDFFKLSRNLTKRISEAKTSEEVKEEFDILKGLASHRNSPATAKTIYGLALLMDDKPWYDLKEGFDWVRKGADEAQDNEPFCWFVLGSLYLNGKPELEPDTISAKHWISKAADAGYKDAQTVMDIEWGENPPGFKEWLSENFDRVEKKWTRQIVVTIALVIIIVGIIILLLLL